MNPSDADIALCRTRLGPRTEQWRLLDAHGRALGFDAVVTRWQTREDFRGFWSSCFRDVPFTAYCWECPPITRATLDRAFECVIVDSPALARSPADPEPFLEHFRADHEVVRFDSLGKDALLVAPCPDDPAQGDFAHLARFLATASPTRMSALWRAVGDAVAGRVGADALWLSTAGLGVSWLHVRLDSRPKYYRHRPYTSFADE